MKQVTTTFFKGLFTLLPLIFSIYVLYWLIASTEMLARSTILAFVPDFAYWPPMGVILVFGLIYGFGVVVDKPLTRGAFNLIEGLFKELPVIKTVYVAIKDFTEYLKPGQSRKANQVVLVRFPGAQVEMIGLMTRENLNEMPAPVTKDARVAVYFPMSYQFGGCTLFIPREWVPAPAMRVEARVCSIIPPVRPGQAQKLATALENK